MHQIVEPNGNLLAADLRDPGLIRIDPTTGVQTLIDVQSTPVTGVAVVSVQVNPFAQGGLLGPYGPPSEKQFKSGGTIPLRWQYTFNGAVINSSQLNPMVSANEPVTCGAESGGDPVVVDAPGSSGLTYETATNTWRFNWKTQKGPEGCFNLVISEASIGVTNTFGIKLVK